MIDRIKNLESVKLLLLQVLSPRLDIGVYNSGKNRKKKTKELEKSSHDGENSQPEVKSEDTYDPATIVSICF